jgi:hypothetical protein
MAHPKIGTAMRMKQLWSEMKFLPVMAKMKGIE